MRHILAAAIATLLLSACNNSNPLPADSRRADGPSTDRGADRPPGQGDRASPDQLRAPDGPKPDPVWKTISGAGPAVADPSATLLADGRVLIVGGYNYPSPTRTVKVCHKQAWLFAPDSNSFVPAGEMKVARVFHTASLLPDGRVLIAGGYDCDDELDSTEIFDPKQPVASAWSSGPALPEKRMGHSAVTLDDGRILLAGGAAWPNYLSSLIIYQPTGGTFQIPAVSLSTGRRTMGATKLSNGKVLLAGGDDGSSAFSRLMEVFDPASGNVTVLGVSLSDKKSGPLAFTLPGGKVHITAGYAFAYPPRDDLYDPVAGTLMPITHPGGSARGSAATLLADGRVLVAGGFETAQEKKARAFGDKGMAWDSLPDMQSARAYLVLVTLKDGSVLAAGGREGAKDTFPAASERLYYP